MASKSIRIEGIGDILLTKRRGQRTIRLSVNGPTVKVSQPSWLPFSAGEAFLRNRLEWVSQHMASAKQYSDGDELPFGLVLTFQRSTRQTIGSRIDDTHFTVLLPPALYPEDSDVQAYVNTRIRRLLRDRAEDYLPKRTTQLADMHGFTYRSVQVRQLKRRWGSCNSKKELVFNLHLMSLDPLHIDYVILHELTHTIHMNHSSEFWDHLESVLPDARKIAKIVRRISF